MVYSRQVNAACFSNLFLYKEKYGTDYTYDDQGNQQAASGTTDKEDGSEYDDYNNLTSYKAPGRDVATTYYWGGTEQEQRRHLLQKATSPLGIVSTFSYDAHGNRTESKVSESESSVAKFIKSTAAYTTAGTYIASQTDARGKTVTTVTDPNKGVVTSVTDPMNQVVNTTYDALRRPTKTSTMLNGQEVKTENEYDAVTGYLKTVRHNTATVGTGDVAYHFEYDSLGRQTCVKVGNDPLNLAVLSTTAYDAVTRQVSQVTFGNGGKLPVWFCR